MSDIERNEIIYEEGWRDNVPAPADEPPVDEALAPGIQEKPQSFPLLISIQLALCVAMAVAMFILKAMDSELYHGIMTYFRAEMNKPVISEELFEAMDISRLNSGYEPIAKASADELQPR